MSNGNPALVPYNKKLPFLPPHRASKDPPASPSENQTHPGCGREGERGHPLPGRSGQIWLFFVYLEYTVHSTFAIAEQSLLRQE